MSIDHEWTHQNKLHCFIPTFSALAYNTAQTANWHNSVTPINSICVNNTPFQNIYSPGNNEPHITLTSANVAWLLNELEPPYKITGSSAPTACIASTYSIQRVDNTPVNATTSWTTTLGLQIIGSSYNNTVSIKPDNASTTGKITAVVTGNNCIPYTVEFKIAGTTDLNYSLDFVGMQNCNYAAKVTPVVNGDSYFWSDGKWATGPGGVQYLNYTAGNATYYPPGTSGYAAGPNANERVYLNLYSNCRANNLFSDNKLFNAANDACSGPYTGPPLANYRKKIGGLQIVASPNPSQDDWILTVDDANAKEMQLRLTDISGRVLWNETLGEGSISYNVIPGKNLVPATYLLGVIIDGIKHQLKLLKQ